MRRMDKKKDICELWQKASSLIKDVSKSADMTSNIKTLENNGEQIKGRAKMMMKHLIKQVDTFYNHLEKSVETIVGQKKALLEYHALEVQQYVTRIKTLCNTAECFIQGYSAHIAQYGPKLKTELEHCIEQADEFNSIDYETFTSLELEANLDNLIKVPLCNIVSVNKQNNEKEVLEAICFDDSLLIDLLNVDISPGTKESLNNLANSSAAEVVKLMKPVDSIPKPVNKSYNNTVTVTNSSSLPNDTVKIEAKISSRYEELKMSNDQIHHCKDLETKTKDLHAAANFPSLSSNTSSLPGKQVYNVKEESLAAASSTYLSSNTSSLPGKQAYNVQDRSLAAAISPSLSSNISPLPGKQVYNVKEESLAAASSTYLSSNTSSLPGKQAYNVQDRSLAAAISPSLSSNTSQLPGKQVYNVKEESLAAASSTYLSSNTSSLPGKQAYNVQDRSPAAASSPMLSSNTSPLPGKQVYNVKEESLAAASSPSLSSNTSSLPSKQAYNVQDRSPAAAISPMLLSNASLPGKQVYNVHQDPSSKKPSVSLNFSGSSANLPVVKSLTEDFAAFKITSKSKVEDEINEQPSTTTGDSIAMNFDVRTFMKTSPHSATKIEAQLIKRINATFDHPTGLTVNQDGHLIVTDTGNDMVKVLEDNHLVFTIGDKDGVAFHRPSAVVCDAVGNIYVKDDKCIRMFNSNGDYLHTIGKGVLQFPYGLSLTEVEDDNVLVLIDVRKRSQSVFHYNIRKDELISYRYQPLIQYGQPTSKVRFLATYKDLMLASDLGASCMYLSNTRGECLNTFGGFGCHAGHFREPSGVTVDSSGNWIVGDSKNNRLQIFNKDGDFLAHIKLSCPIRRPSGIHLTNDGKLFVINYLDSEVLVFQLY